MEFIVGCIKMFWMLVRSHQYLFNLFLMEMLKSFFLVLVEKKPLRIGRVRLTSPTILDLDFLMGMWLVFGIVTTPNVSHSDHFQIRACLFGSKQ